MPDVNLMANSDRFASSRPNQFYATNNLYSVNKLNSFSFGSAHTSTPPVPPPVDPLTVPHDQEQQHFDLTPRASLAEEEFRPFRESRRHSNARSTITMDSSIYTRDPARGDSDAASHRTFGTSSASASVTSLSSNDHIGSRNSRYSSANNTDNESSRSDMMGSGRAALSSDDDEYDYYDDDEDDEFDVENDPAYAIEIGSAQYDDDASGWGQFSSGSPSHRRKGSLPMAIPQRPTDEYRHQETMTSQIGNLIQLRRQSRSLDDDLPTPRIFASDSSHKQPPSSVPTADGDWKALSDKNLPQRRGSLSPTHALSYDKFTASPQNVAGPATDFDMDWSNMAIGGITSLNHSDFAADVDGKPVDVDTAIRKSSAISILTLDDPFQKQVMKWDNEGYGSSRRSEWTFKREIADGPGPIVSTSSQAKAPSGSKLGMLLPVAQSQRGRERDMDRVGLSSVTSTRTLYAEEKDRRLKDQERRAPENWRGMPLGSGEVWWNALIGRYNVIRDSQASSDVNKGPQQRLSIAHFRDNTMRLSHRAPSVTVHKHSRATAFSISRFYKYRPTTRSIDQQGGHELSSMYPSARESTTSRVDNKVINNKHKASTMILLAPKAVQLDYTNTNTTRKLEHHGLLGQSDQSLSTFDFGKGNGPDKQDKRAGHEKQKKSRELSKKDREKSQTSSTGSVVTVSTAKPLPPDDIPDSRRTRRRRASIDMLDDDGLPERTPHSETYSTIDPSAIEQYLQDRPQSHQPQSFLGRVLSASSRGGSSSQALGGSANYNPPWLVMNTRGIQEQQKNTIHSLTRSFADVGLVASKERRHSVHQDRRPSRVTTDVFDQIPSNSLFMLLPLWPGETDQHSRVREPPGDAPNIPLNERLFLLVVYKAKAIGGVKVAVPNPSKSKKKSTTKSPNPHERSDDRHILLSAFDISARILTYRDLRGSCVRVPEVGISVCGSMDEAVKTMPHRVKVMMTGSQIIASCASRERGIEFDMDGLDALGLCGRAIDPTNTEAPMCLPTPVGRAVMEMAWIGGMALTSFGSLTS